MQIDAPPKPEKTYVTVLASIDQTGLMEPREIIWPDGRKFPIDRVECWRKALDHGPETTYYVIEIGGRETDPVFYPEPGMQHCQYGPVVCGIRTSVKVNSPPPSPEA